LKTHKPEPLDTNVREKLAEVIKSAEKSMTNTA